MKKASLISKDVKLTNSKPEKGLNNYKGFTLIELLAVIIILAIIALIAVPLIMNIIDKAKKSAFEDSA
ncbi:MAG: prepilin-type N-terminal cleavage/methylation domain-containing protein, partial [Bacilli bacterium]